MNNPATTNTDRAKLAFAIERANELLAWLVVAPPDRSIKRGAHVESLRRVIEFATATLSSSASQPVAWAVQLADGSISKLGWMDMRHFESMKKMCTLAQGCKYVFASPPNAGTDSAREPHLVEYWNGYNAAKKIAQAIRELGRTEAYQRGLHEAENLMNTLVEAQKHLGKHPNVTAARADGVGE